MAKVFRGAAVIGALWALLVSWLLVAVQDSWIQGAGYALVLLTLMLTVLSRLYHLRRWAALAVCLYSGYLAAAAPVSGIWQWTVFCTGIAVGFCFLTWKGWNTLRPGI